MIDWGHEKAMAMIEIREMRHLMSIDEFRHFGRAAKAVGLSQSALTKSLQRLEQSLGAKLFERSRAGVAPTDIGKEVLARARRLLDEAAELERTVDLMNGSEIGPVALGIGPAMSETNVVSAIAAVAQQRPRTQISIRVDHWQQLSDWLLAGELDFYVADVGEARIDGRYQYTSLAPQEFVWPELTTHAGIIRMSDRTLSPLAEELISCIESLADSASRPKQLVR